MKDNFWLEAKAVSAFRNNFEVVKEINLKLRVRENVLILGPNGSGKSSIIDLINRNIYPIENDNSIFRLFNSELINIWEARAKINCVNSEIKYRINKEMKVFELIISGFYGKYCKIKNIRQNERQEANDLIKIMSLEKIANKKLKYLSDGEMQIALIARAIINNPQVLILDEPSINLDIKAKNFLIKKIKELSKKDLSILCVTHDIDMITKIYDRIILLKDRQIIADGNPCEVMNSKNINKLFEINVEIIETDESWSIIKNKN